MKHKSLLSIAAAAVTLLIVLYVVTLKFVLPLILKSKIIASVNEICAECDLQIDSISIPALNPGSLKFKNLSLKAGQPNRSMADVKIETLELNVDISNTRSKLLVIDSLSGDGLDVIYLEGEAPKKAAISSNSHTPAGSAKVEDPFLFVIKETRFSNLEFRYSHTQFNVTSHLQFHDVSGSITAIGNTPEQKDQMTEADLRGTIEKSGQGQLKIAALTRPGPHYVDVNVLIEDQNLEDLNSFFTSNDGIVFHGQIVRALTKINVRDQRSKSHIEASYKNVDFKQTPTPTTSPIEAMLTNLGADLLMNRSNLDHLPQDRESDLDIQREKSEALVHFILRSMKEGLIQVAKKKDSRK